MKGTVSMILYPMVISAVAVLLTLAYASYLDVRDRRVPFVTWYPMIIVGIPSTVWLLYDTTKNVSLLVGYLALVASFLYANYLDNREPDAPFRFPYLAVVLILPAVSWFILAKNFTLSLVPWYGMYAGILLYISYDEYRKITPVTIKQKRKRQQANISDALSRWYFILVIIILTIASIIMMLGGGWGLSGIYIALAAIFCGVFYLFGRMHLFGGADAWALIFIAFCIPTFPITPLLNNPPLGFLSFSVLVNALVLTLVAPLGIFIINIVKGNRAPLRYMFFGFPVKGDAVQDAWGYVMEEFTETKEGVNRRFIGIGESIKKIYSGEERVYTKDLRENPDAFKKELALYKNAGTVWISYAVPFIIPITLGLITAIVFGDFLLAIMNAIV
jgi:archaeal preflagellin peptidase FlaK